MERAQGRARLVGRDGLAWIVGLWSAAALLAGTSSYALQQMVGSHPAPLRAISGPAVASAIWIVLSVAIVGLVRAAPPLRLEDGVRLRPGALGLHLAAAGVVTFLLNAAFHAIHPDAAGSGMPYPTRVFRTGMANLHLNFGVYWIVVVGTLVAPRMTGAGRTGATASRATRRGPAITVRSGSDRIRVAVGDIRWIEGAGDYARLHLEGAEHLLSERLKHLERRLDPGRFVRVHRSAIVNVDTVERLRHLGRGDYRATLTDGTAVRVSRTRRAELQRALDSRELPERRDEGATGPG